jgi:hypothetical protein
MEHRHITNGSVSIAHRFATGFLLQPGDVIDTITYQEDRIEFFEEDHSTEPAASIRSACLLFLGGQTYAADLGTFGGNGSARNWARISRTLTRDNFVAADGTTRPDFANSTNPYFFGYRRATTANQTRSNMTEEFHHGIDNWMVTINYRSRA